MKSFFRKGSHDLLHWPFIQPVTLEAISNDILCQTSVSEYPEHFPSLCQGLLSPSVGQTFVTVANNQLTNIVFLWKYDWVLFAVGQHNCFLQPASNMKNRLHQHWFQLCKPAGTLCFLVGLEVSQFFSKTLSLN